MNPGLPFRNPVIHRYFALVITMLLTISTSFGQTIGAWDFNGTLTGVPGTNNTVSTAGFSPGIPTRSFNGNEYYGENGWPAGGINTAMYMQFILTPGTGHELSILSITLRMRRSNTGSPSGSGPVSWSLRSSLDGYTSDLGSGSMTHNYANYTVLTGGGFGSLPSAITFRVYGYNASTSTGGNSRLVFDNITVAGFGPVLPVHLLSFNARASTGSIALQYTLANTETSNRYIVQRSVDGSNFYPIHTNIETASRDRVTYSYDDNLLPAGVLQFYYRLQMIDQGGRSIYSSVVYASFATNATVTARIGQQSLFLYGSILQQERVAVFNSSGICVFNQMVLPFSGSQMINVRNAAVAKGIYYVVIGNDSRKQVTKVLAE